MPQMKAKRRPRVPAAVRERAAQWARAGLYRRPARSKRRPARGSGSGRRDEVVEHLLEEGAWGVGFAARDGGAGVPEDGDHVAGDGGVGDGVGPSDDGGLLPFGADGKLANVGRDVVLMTEGVEV